MKLYDRIRTFAQVLYRSPSLGADNKRWLRRELKIATTPSRLVHAERAFRLLAFEPAGAALDAPPILMVPSLINRWYVLDLMPGHSLVEALVTAGHRVYVVAWSDAHAGQGPLPFSAWVDSFLRRALLRTLRDASASGVTLLGQCLGGDLALALAATHPAGIDRLVTLTTPVDFSEAGLLATWTSEELTDVGRLTEPFPGVVPDDIVYGAFPLLNPRALVTRHRVLFQLLHFEEFKRVYQAIDLWTTDHLPVASGALRGIVGDLYQRNALYSGTWRMAAGPVDLKQVQVPLLNVMAKDDDIAPQASVRPLMDLVGTPEPQEFVSQAGHVTLILGSPLRFRTYAAIHAFCS